MQLTRAADYAVRVMVHMASLPPGARANRTDLAASVGCPEQFLSKVLQGLTKAGLISSHRGNSGGFELPTARLHTTVLEIVEAIEGPIHLNVCLKSFEECGRASGCPAYPVWVKAQQSIVDVLGGVNIEEMALQARVAGASQAVKLQELPCT
jgi:Rrf2 family transcriptional regulator, iron-sulfur cluster assembly transcription factor